MWVCGLSGVRESGTHEPSHWPCRPQPLPCGHCLPWAASLGSGGPPSKSCGGRRPSPGSRRPSEWPHDPLWGSLAQGPGPRAPAAATQRFQRQGLFSKASCTQWKTPPNVGWGRGLPAPGVPGKEGGQRLLAPVAGRQPWQEQGGAAGPATACGPSGPGPSARPPPPVHPYPSGCGCNGLTGGPRARALTQPEPSALLDPKGSHLAWEPLGRQGTGQTSVQNLPQRVQAPVMWGRRGPTTG